MQRIKSLLIASFLVCFCFTGQSNAQVALKKIGQSTMNFLKVGVSPTAAGMGNAFTTIGGGAVSMFYNPSGLADHSGYSVFLSNTQWIADISYNAGALSRSFGSIGVFGISFLMVDYGDIQGTRLLSKADPKGYEEIEIGSVGAYAFGVGYARQVSHQFSMGGQVQFVGQNLGETELATGKTENAVFKTVLNFGMKFFPGYKSFRFAMAIRNFSSSAEYEEVSAPLPLIFTVGVGIDILDIIAPGHSANNSFLASAEFLHPNNFTERVNIGGEYKFAGLIAVRGGYQFNHDLAGLSLGFGITSPSIAGAKVELNYSYSDHDVFNGVNRFSLDFKF